MKAAIRVPNPVRVDSPSVASDGGYALLPFRFLRLDANRTLVVNDIGEHVLLSNDAFDQFVGHALEPDSAAFRALKTGCFLTDSLTSDLLKVIAERYRLKKSFLAGFTKLHIFVVSLRCEHSCQYCQVSRQSANRLKYDMSRETADKSIELMFRSPAPRITMEFQGGEPLLNFELIRYMVEKTLEVNHTHHKRIDFVIATNLALVTDEILDFCKEHDVSISTSLDGPAFLHNTNRPRPGNNSYELTVEGIRRVRETLGFAKVSALMTTSRLSLDHPVEIIDEYLKQGFRAIFLRPISPYGFAVKTRRRTGYEFEKFWEFYKTGFEYILELNRRGIDFQETYAKIILTKILTPFPTHYVDLQSPAGIGVGVVVYNYDGDVYASDESRMLAEMNDRRFRLGNVHGDSYETLFLSEALTSAMRASTVEALPGCAECAFQPFCGADPVFHYATQGDVVGHRPTSEFHLRNFGIIRLLFQYLYGRDEELRRILLAWVTDKSVSQIRKEELVA